MIKTKYVALGQGQPVEREASFVFSHDGGRVPLSFWRFLDAELPFQMGLLPSRALDFEADRDVSNGVFAFRVTVARFARRFLRHFRDGGGHQWHPHPFLVFLLVPRSLLSADSALGASGLFGYRYVLDSCQREYLARLRTVGIQPISNWNQAITAEYVPFPFGLCGKTYLTGRTCSPLRTSEVIEEYLRQMPGLAELERTVLARSVLMEVPVYLDRSERPELIRDGPDALVCICLPDPEDSYSDELGFSSGGSRSEGDLGRLLTPPLRSSFGPGEVEALREYISKIMRGHEAAIAGVQDV